MSKRYLYIISLVVITSACFGQSQGIQTDTISAKKINMLLVPIVFYTPETSFAGGAGGQIFFKTNKSAKTLDSNIFGSVVYTANKQFILEAKPQLYFGNKNYFLNAAIKYRVYPNFFWGLGPNTPDSAEEGYNQTETTITASFLKRLPSNVNFGFEFNYGNYNITEVQEGGLLESGTIEGSEGANLVGLGVVLNVDSRDNIFAPLGGEFYQFKTNFNSRVMGSTHSFNTYHIDLRKYISLGNNNVLAMQVYTRFTFGNSPFQAKAYYGGADVARGYFKGRYIDDHLYVVQLEYRKPIMKRWELGAFILTGNVGHEEPGQELFSDFKSSFGFGPRFFIFEDQRTLLRLDIGYDQFGNSGIYFGINEAF